MLSPGPHEMVSITSRAKRWVEIWDEQLRFYRIHSRGLIYCDLLLALEVALEELDTRRTQSSWMRDIARARIRSIAHIHPAIRTQTMSHRLLELEKELATPTRDVANRTRYLIENLNTPAYNTTLVEVLAALLESDKPLRQRDERDLELLTTDLLIRLLRRGYGLRRLASMLSEIFGGYALQESGALITRFPLGAHGFDATMIRFGFVIPDHAQRAKTLLDSLSQSERLKGLLEFIHREPKSRTYVFGIDGLQGNAQFNIGTVSFYSPLTGPLLDASSDPTTELINRERDARPMNAAVSVSVVDEDQGEFKAQELVDEALDILRVAARAEAPLQIRRHRQILINPGFGIYRYHELPVDDLEYIISTSISADECSRERLAANSLISQCSDVLGDYSLSGSKHIAAAAHWYRKAHDSRRPEDRLIFYWVTLEKLFAWPHSTQPMAAGADSTSKAIFKIIPAVMALLAIRSLPEATHYYLQSYGPEGLHVGFAPMLYGDEFVNTIRSDVRTDWSTFESWLETAIEIVPESRMRDYLCEIRDGLDNNAIAFRLLKASEMEVRTELSMIYWLRNRLIHDAEFQHPALEYYADAAAGICTEVLRLVIGSATHGTDVPVDKILDVYRESSILFSELKHGHETLRMSFSSQSSQ